jgi:hypothetical protein
MNESPLTFFASKSIVLHLARGLAAIVLIVYAIRVGETFPVRSVVAGLCALAMLRGCPACWALGLIETVRQRIK